MSDAMEDRINLIRNQLVEASLDLTEFQTHSEDGVQELDAVQNKIEDVLVEFERLVHEMVEAK